MDGHAFIEGVRLKLIPIAPIVAHAINKQLIDIGTTPEMMNPQEAELFIKNMHGALLLFLGPEGAKTAQNAMKVEFRKAAPEYFEERNLI